MKIKSKQIKSFEITEVDGLDPISVILEDIEKGSGKIIISCYDKSWTTYWNAMGKLNILDFFVSCDSSYLTENLDRGLPNTIVDNEKIIDYLKNKIIKSRHALDISKEKARELFDRLAVSDEKNISCDLLYQILGDDWWNDMVYKPNPKYQYLMKIVDTVKLALKTI